ncbi:MAG: hypothetical protein KDA79_02180 [Planctomycetaceae bacterium]|nr:hypothetical protein [Planctomycetaceae bacterium]
MTFLNRVPPGGLLLVILLTAGCSDSDRTAENSAAGPRVPPPVDTPDSAAAPAAGVNSAIRGLVKHQPAAVWEYLPRSWQQELNSLVRSSASGVDERVWNRTIAVARRGVKLLEDRQSAVFRNEALRQILTRDGRWEEEEVRSHWTAITALAREVLSGPLASHQAMQQFRGKEWLQQSGPAIVEQFAAVSALDPADPFGNLSRVEASFVRMEGQVAVVRITSPRPGEAASDFQFVEVEGRWIPDNLAAGWPVFLDSAQQRVRQFSSAASTIPVDQALSRLDRIESVIASLEETRTQDEFDQVLLADVILPLGAAVMALEGGRIGPAAGNSPPPSGDSPGTSEAPAPAAGDTPGTDAATGNTLPEKTVRVVIAPAEPSGQLSGPLLRRIEEQLQQLGDSDDTDLQEGSALPGQTVFLVSPVNDLAKFAKQIDFGQVTKIEQATRTVHVSLPATGTAPPE